MKKLNKLLERKHDFSNKFSASKAVLSYVLWQLGTLWKNVKSIKHGERTKK